MDADTDTEPEPEVTPLDLAYEIVDRIMLCGPSGWSQLELTFTPVGEAHAILAKEADLSGDHPVVSFPCDVFQQTGFLNNAFVRLQAELEPHGIRWGWGKARLERTAAGTIKLRLLDDDQETANFELSAADLLFGEELATAYETREAAFGAHQARLTLQGAGGWGAWLLNEATGTLDFLEDDQLVARAPAVVLGSYSRLEQTWCWSWANRHWLEHPCLVEPVRELANSASEWPGMGVFRMPGFDADPIFSDALAQLAADLLGGHAVYFGRLEAITLYIAVAGDIHAVA